MNEISVGSAEQTRVFVGLSPFLLSAQKEGYPRRMVFPFFFFVGFCVRNCTFSPSFYGITIRFGKHFPSGK